MTSTTPPSLAWSHDFSIHEPRASPATACLVDAEITHKLLAVPLVALGRQLSTLLQLFAHQGSAVLVRTCPDRIATLVHAPTASLVGPVQPASSVRSARIHEVHFKLPGSTKSGEDHCSERPHTASLGSFLLRGNCALQITNRW